MAFGVLHNALRSRGVQIAASSAQSKPVSFFSCRSQFLGASSDFLSSKSDRSSVTAFARTQGPSVSRKSAHGEYIPSREYSSYDTEQRTPRFQPGETQAYRSNSQQLQSTLRSRETESEDGESSKQPSENVILHRNEVVLVGRVVGEPESYPDASGGIHMRFGLAVVNDSSKKATLPIPIKVKGPAVAVAKEHLSPGVMVRLQGKLQSEEVEERNGQLQRQLYVFADQCLALDPASARRYESPSSTRGGHNDVYNMTTVVGRAAMDPTLQTTATGVDVCNFSIAVSGGLNEPPVWVRLQLWDRQAEAAVNRVTKGVLMEVSGHLKASSYNDRLGVSRRQLALVSHRFYLLNPGQSQSQGQGQGRSRSWSQDRDASQRPGRFSDGRQKAQSPVQQWPRSSSRPSGPIDPDLDGANF